MALIVCCKNCTERYLGCHSECEQYKKEKEEVVRVRELARKNKQMGYLHPSRGFH